jgi:hypothetical protein
MNDRHRQRRKILKGNYDLLILHLVALLDKETKEQIRQSVRHLVVEKP